MPKKEKEEVIINKNSVVNKNSVNPDDGEARVDEKPRETTVEFLASLAGVLVTGLFIITFVLQAFEIPSSSMENTLLVGGANCSRFTKT